jgi:hypothetical protein
MNEPDMCIGAQLTEQGREIFGWMTYHVWDLRDNYPLARSMDGAITTAGMERMLVSPVLKQASFMPLIVC